VRKKELPNTVNKLIIKIEFDKIQRDLENYQNEEKFPSRFPNIYDCGPRNPHAGFIIFMIVNF
jgi:hypothetical protein